MGNADTNESTQPTPTAPRKPSGQWIAVGFIVLWVVLVVAVYVVVVQLQIGGSDSIRDATPADTTPTTRTIDESE